MSNTDFSSSSRKKIPTEFLIDLVTPPWQLGNFARQLNSPLVTLVVGKEKTQFFAHEEVLSKVAFFKNALLAFREPYAWGFGSTSFTSLGDGTTSTAPGTFASDNPSSSTSQTHAAPKAHTSRPLYPSSDPANANKLIHMPSDDPEIVSKLLEFLYTDNYTPLEVPSSVFSSSNPQYSSEPLRLQERNNDRRTFIIKLFHAHVYALAEKYSYQPLCELAASRVRQNLIYLGPQLLEYMVGVYEATPRTSAMRIANLMRGGEGKFVHGTAWDPDSMRHWVSTWWRADGGFEGANEEGGIMVEAFKRCPELARDLLVLVSDVAHDD